MRLIALAAYNSACIASLRHATVTCKDHIIRVCYEKIPLLTVDLMKWSIAAVNSMSQYKDSIAQLFPPGISLTDFPFDCLTENVSHAAIFKQPGNAKWLDVFQEKICTGIFQHFGLYGAKGINVEPCQC
jgi:hypothetical protein